MDLKNIVFMKYGTHANESPSRIIKNKINEVDLYGHTFWGYGGTSCHPLNQVQPFIKMNFERGEKTFLLLSRIKTVWNGSSTNASFYSYNKMDWLPLPKEHIIKGSKFAIMCSSFEECNFTIDLSSYHVPIGNAKGRLLSNYIFGMNTKGCGTFALSDRVETEKLVQISAIAEIESAVFIR